MPDPDRPEAVDRSGAADEASSSSTSLFDLRYLIGALFTFYGAVLTVASFVVPHPQSGSIDINLWLGLGMAGFGLLFLGWARWRPLRAGGPSAAARGGRAGPGEPPDAGPDGA